jgi:hypothetical protein
MLFHGPCLQAMTRLTGLDETGMTADVAASAPPMLVRSAGAADQWLFDPALLDAAAQMAWLWSCQQSDAPALPNRFASIRRFSGCGPARRMVLRIEPGAKASPEVRAEVLVLDEAGRLVFAIDTLESTASPALNRMRGWSGEIRV